MKTMTRVLGLALIVGGVSLGVMALADTLSDAQIAGIVKAANRAEIDAAKTVKSRSDNQQVKDFAREMIADHKENLKQEKALDKKLKIKPATTDVSDSMTKDATGKVADLKQMKGADFDKVYIDSQVAMHQQLLTDLDQTLIPGAQSPDLKAFLEQTKQHVQEHLSQAQALQTNMTK